MQKITPFLWYDNQAQEAAAFYCSVFKNSKVIHSSPMVTTFELQGQTIMAMNGGPHFKLNESFSLFVNCEDQKEVDELWKKLTADGGQESMCGWLKDKYGLSWQIIPVAFTKLMMGNDAAKSERVMAALLKMKKIDIAALEKAAEG